MTYLEDKAAVKSHLKKPRHVCIHGIDDDGGAWWMAHCCLPSGRCVQSDNCPTLEEAMGQLRERVESHPEIKKAAR
jgi:hypothetical protein